MHRLHRQVIVVAMLPAPQIVKKRNPNARSMVELLQGADSSKVVTVLFFSMVVWNLTAAVFKSCLHACHACMHAGPPYPKKAKLSKVCSRQFVDREIECCFVV